MNTPSLNSLAPRQHIQDHDTAESLEPHWGYADRVLPCVVDAGSCEYLDEVYGAHDIGMYYTGILWLTILGIILILAVFKHVNRPLRSPLSPSMSNNFERREGLGGLTKLHRAITAIKRRYLLPDSVRIVFGRTTRFQVLVLAALCVYLTIWSFVGISYSIWITPVKDHPGVYNTRSSLGPWSDRVGVLAYALTPLTVLLANRESLLSLFTGVPYQSFNFLHRWLGYIIFVQSALHTIGWCIIEIRLYQPQPKVAVNWITQTYMIWGLVAMILLTIMFILSTPWGIRMTGYEFFRKAHYVLAMVYIGACWAHWEALKCFMIPSLIFWFLDRGARFIRSGLLHYQLLPSGDMGFRPAYAAITRFPDSEYGDIIRLDLEINQDPWVIGQHYYLCFTESSIWQSHPFTPLNEPVVRDGKVSHSYILRAKGGETKKLAQMAAEKTESTSGIATTPVILTGPYGESLMDAMAPNTNVLCIAGGTGITYVLPVLLGLARQPRPSSERSVELIWVMRHANNIEWVQKELDLLYSVQDSLQLKIRLYATRDASGSGSDESTSPSIIEKKQMEVKKGVSEAKPILVDDSVAVKKMGGDKEEAERHPDLTLLVQDFIDTAVCGPTTVFASGPGNMISDLRTIVASCNSGSKVWQGNERFDVRLVCDDRLEW
jgi:predicted ferric reductase